MRKSMFMTIIMATLAIVMSTTMAQAGVIYSEDFDGLGVTPGQSVTLAPFNWTTVVDPGVRTNQRIFLNSGINGFTGNFLDGETAINDYDAYARLGVDLPPVPADTPSLTFGFNLYADSPGGDPIFGNNVTIGDKTNIPHRIGWSINSGIISFTADGGTTSWTAGGIAYHNEMLTMHIYADFVADKVWADVSKNGGATYITSPQYQLDLPANQFNYWGLTADLRGNIRSIQMDNIVVSITKQGLSGHVDFQDFSGSNWLAPLGIELIQGGTVMRAERVFLDSNNDYSISNVTAGTYDVRFSANKWLTRTEPGIVITADNPTILDVSLVNGDLNGDNAVTSTDLSIALKNLN